ncbi:MAG: pantoate--beta-alanine ligase [Alistipes sp.]|nr:pantoate--beta-alanine ligase [Candidatus Alistipes equi]
MKVFTTVKELQKALKNVSRESVGMVPTMGALHEGHLSLVRRAKEECKTVVVSVFVNPTQFNDKNDLRNYPRTPQKDAQMLEEAGVDYVLMPSVEEIYPEPDTRVFDFGMVDKVMEGASRPGHFNGVAQVVSRLFDIVKPGKAFFGEKDFQQIAVVKAMVAQLSLPVEIVPCPIVREKSGLALSSRNQLLDQEHRQAAPHIYAILKDAVELSKESSVEDVCKFVSDRFQKESSLDLIYFSLVDSLTMQNVKTWNESQSVQGCIAVQAGNIRLIDNICFR